MTTEKWALLGLGLFLLLQHDDHQVQTSASPAPSADPPRRPPAQGEDLEQDAPARLDNLPQAAIDLVHADHGGFHDDVGAIDFTGGGGGRSGGAGASGEV